jgi:hypothetical protein
VASQKLGNGVYFGNNVSEALMPFESADSKKLLIAAPAAVHLSSDAMLPDWS